MESTEWKQIQQQHKMCGFGEPGSRESLPVAVRFDVLLEGQLRAPVSQQFRCQEDTVNSLNEVSSQSSRG